MPSAEERVEVLTQRLRRLLPLPIPEAGLHYALTRLFGRALGGAPIVETGGDGPSMAGVPGHEPQMQQAVLQADMGAYSQRSDTVPFAYNSLTTTGLTYGYQGGTITLTPNTVTYLTVLGGSSVSGSPTGWDPDGMKMALVFTDATSITAIFDMTQQDWSESTRYSWRFNTTTDAGAEAEWLDAWGNVLGVARRVGEGDYPYSLRILTEVGLPGASNYGMGSIVDGALGVDGTEVLEADEVFQFIRYNQPGIRSNAGNRLNQAGGIEGSGAGCFVVMLPTYLSSTGWTLEELRGLVNRRKAAGTRMVAVGEGTSKRPLISAPMSATAGIAAQATSSHLPNATGYTWTATNATITAGQGTDTITFIPTAAGQVDLQVVVSRSVGGPSLPGRKSLTAYTLPTISAPAYGIAGRRPYSASISGLPTGLEAVWTVSNGTIVSGQGTTAITFEAGEAGDNTITMQLSNVFGPQVTNTKLQKIVPWPTTQGYTTGSLAPSAAEDVTLDFGWGWNITRVITSKACRVRAYGSAAQRAADAVRSPFVVPSESAGVLLDLLMLAGSFDLTLDPQAPGANKDIPQGRAIYLRIENKDVTTGPIPLTFHYQETQDAAH